MITEYRGQTLVGSQPKYSIKLSLPNSLTMDDVDFSAKFYVIKSSSVTYQKSSMTRVSANEYTCIVNTTNMSKGNLDVEITVSIPETGQTRIEKILLTDIDRLY